MRGWKERENQSVHQAEGNHGQPRLMAPNSSTLAWKIPWTEEPGKLQSMGSRRVGTRLSDFTFTIHSHQTRGL